MIHILYLAAGNSRRFGSNKLQALLDGKPLFLHGLDRLNALSCQRTDCTLTVVSQHDFILDAAEKKGIRAVYSPDSPLGLSYTIRAGLASLPDLRPEDFILFMVADQPRLSTETITALLDLAQPGVTAASTAFGTRQGNPTLFSAQLLPELLTLAGDQGGRVVLRRHAADCRTVQAHSASELWDIDRPDDLAHFTDPDQ